MTSVRSSSVSSHHSPAREKINHPTTSAPLKFRLPVDVKNVTIEERENGDLHISLNNSLTYRVLQSNIQQKKVPEVLMKELMKAGEHYTNKIDKNKKKLDDALIKDINHEIVNLNSIWEDNISFTVPVDLKRNFQDIRLKLNRFCEQHKDQIMSGNGAPETRPFELTDTKFLSVLITLKNRFNGYTMAKARRQRYNNPTKQLEIAPTRPEAEAGSSKRTRSAINEQSREAGRKFMKIFGLRSTDTLQSENAELQEPEAAQKPSNLTEEQVNKLIGIAFHRGTEAANLQRSKSRIDQAIQTEPALSGVHTPETEAEAPSGDDAVALNYMNGIKEGLRRLHQPGNNVNDAARSVQFAHANLDFLHRFLQDKTAR